MSYAIIAPENRGTGSAFEFQGVPMPARRGLTLTTFVVGLLLFSSAAQAQPTALFPRARPR